MSRKLFATAVLAAATAVLHAPPATAIVPAPKVVRIGDSGKTVSLVAGQELQIKLQECLTCGYHWATRTAPDPRVLRRLPKRTTNPCKPPCVGGVNTTTFRYAGRAVGITNLRLVYLPPGDAAPTKSFRLRVRVRSA